ncbi:MAG: HEAT repeat domain-containing protein, partial [Kiritimatiellae bacterium]|nr:HEAT repeat domain-containing protein [Kiritimatiellia bacterium]
CEIHRWRHGVDDIRHRGHMLLEDLSSQSSADRLSMFENHYDKHPAAWYTNYSDVIKLIEDTDGDGMADKSTVFADDFNDPLDGPGIGVIERDGDVYYTCIPHLWKLKDTNGDSKADTRESLQDGFGIRMSFSGHDMHGMIWGPDGKLYWSIGDRGYSFTTKEGKRFHGPNEGAVFRCDPDGSNIELFYDRLRNPQELAFDDYGNLFTADNDGDRSDKERINYLVEGGDSGWHAGHQVLMSFGNRYGLRLPKYSGEGTLNAWEHEKMWKVRDARQPAFMLPGIGQLHTGPSGLTFNPSSSLGEVYDDKFFVALYSGSAARSRVEMFDIQDDGAGFETANHKTVFNGVNAVDLDFGPDGSLYISEYNYGGWGNADVGNIFRLYDETHSQKPHVVENHKIWLSDYSKKTNTELATLLSRDHKDLRYRAQFELLKRGKAGAKVLINAAQAGPDTFARIHGVWGLGMVARKNPAVLSVVRAIANDENDQVRIQALRVLGDHRDEAAAQILKAALEDAHPRAAMYAAIGLGRISDDSAVPALIALARRNDDKDLFLRHGIVMGLFGVKERAAWTTFANDKSAAVRMVVLLTMRRHRDPALARFLQDADMALSFEAIRAINDLPIEEATSQLAAHLPKLGEAKDDVERMMHTRVINANWYAADVASAKRLLAHAANTTLHPRQRIEALIAIEAWNDEVTVDGSTGLPRPVPTKRDDIMSVFEDLLPTVLDSAEGKVLATAIRLASTFGVALLPSRMARIVSDESKDDAIRLAILDTLIEKRREGTVAVLETLLKDSRTAIRVKALEGLLAMSADNAIATVLAFAEAADLNDRQTAYALMAAHGAEPRVVTHLLSALETVINDTADPAIQLDILESCRASSAIDVKRAITACDLKRAALPPTQRFATSLQGGDVDQGRLVFETHGAAQCVRCHKVNGQGSTIGPDLSAIGLAKKRLELLEAVVDPGATIASGFGLVSMTMKDGTAVGGTLIDETEDAVSLKDADGKTHTYAKAGIKQRSDPVSGMPPMAAILKPVELRDLIAYLATLKRAPEGGH